MRISYGDPVGRQMQSIDLWICSENAVLPQGQEHSRNLFRKLPEGPICLFQIGNIFACQDSGFELIDNQDVNQAQYEFMLLLGGCGVEDNANCPGPSGFGSCLNDR